MPQSNFGKSLRSSCWGGRGKILGKRRGIAAKCSVPEHVFCVRASAMQRVGDAGGR